MKSSSYQQLYKTDRWGSKDFHRLSRVNAYSNSNGEGWGVYYGYLMPFKSVLHQPHSFPHPPA